jgi:hypothetical protein
MLNNAERRDHTGTQYPIVECSIVVDGSGKLCSGVASYSSSTHLLSHDDITVILARVDVFATEHHSRIKELAAASRRAPSG